jgi:hypothetical protein
MANSVLIDRWGPDWPLGFIKVASAGTPVGVMSVVDPNSYNAPGTPTSKNTDEYTATCQSLIFMGYQPSATGAAYKPNTGNVYIVRAPAGSGSGGKGDTGVLVKVLAPAETWELSAAALNRNSFSPYRYYIDADNNNDGAMITAVVQ